MSYEWKEQPCPICERPPSKRRGRRGGTAHRQGFGVECEVWQCGGCGLIFPNPMPYPAGGLGQHYDTDAEGYFAGHDWEAKTEAARGMLAQAREIAGGQGRLLDIGSGRGELLTEAVARGWDAVGIEPSPVFRAEAERQSGAEVRAELLEECRFPHGSFQVVFLSAVLEHLYDPNATVAEIARVLAPGGVVYLDAPNEHGLYFRLGNLYQRLRGRDWVVNLAPTFAPFHTFGFGPRSIRKLLAKHGLQVARWQFFPGGFEVPDAGSKSGRLERVLARLATRLSRIGSLGNYMAVWARRL